VTQEQLLAEIRRTGASVYSLDPNDAEHLRSESADPSRNLVRQVLQKAAANEPTGPALRTWTQICTQRVWNRPDTEHRCQAGAPVGGQAVYRSRGVGNVHGRDPRRDRADRGHLVPLLRRRAQQRLPRPGPGLRPPPGRTREVEPTLQVAGQQTVFAIGDLSTAYGKMAGFARLRAETAVANITALTRGESDLAPYEPMGVAIVVPVGPTAGAGQIPGHDGIIRPGSPPRSRGGTCWPTNWPPFSTSLRFGMGDASNDAMEPVGRSPAPYRSGQPRSIPRTQGQTSTFRSCDFFDVGANPSFGLFRTPSQGRGVPLSRSHNEGHGDVSPEGSAVTCFLGLA
jgi:hypothetical protein